MTPKLAKMARNLLFLALVALGILGVVRICQELRPDHRVTKPTPLGTED